MNYDKEIPISTPSPVHPSRVIPELPEATEPLLPSQHSAQSLPHNSLEDVDLEAGSRQRARMMAIVAMTAIIITAVVRKYPYTSGFVLTSIVFTFFLFSMCAALLIGLAGFLTVLYHASDQVVYCPDYPPDARISVMMPSSVGLPSENLRLYASDGTVLHAVFVGQNDSVTRRNAITMLYLHGNAGNMGHRLANVCGLYHRLHCNLLLLEYRGYGFSSGHPSEGGLYQDASAALSYLQTRQDVDATKVVIFGRSLGGAIAIELASRLDARQQLRALVVENTFTSIPDMAKSLISDGKIIKNLPLFCYRNKFLSRNKMLRVQVPTLVISGMRDTLVPPPMAVQLHQCCASRHKRLYRFSSGTHNETWRCAGYYNALKFFFDEITRGVPLPPPSLPQGVSIITDSSQIM